MGKQGREQVFQSTNPWGDTETNSPAFIYSMEVTTSGTATGARLFETSAGCTAGLFQPAHSVFL